MKRPMKETLNDDDLKHKSSKEILAEVFLGILRYAPIPERISPENFDEALKKALGFANAGDHERYRAAIDLLEDTQYAILEVFARGLHTNDDRYQQHGEQYLRLYGALNAINLQISSIHCLHQLHSNSHSKKILEELKALLIYRVRNMAGAHSLDNLVERGRKETTFHRVTQTTLSKWGKQLYVTSNGNDSLEFALIPSLNEYEDMSTRVLFDLASEVIRIRFTKKTEHRMWLVYRLEYVKSRIKVVEKA